MNIFFECKQTGFRTTGITQNNTIIHGTKRERGGCNMFS